MFMRELSIKAKFDVGDSVYGFPDKELHNLIIDRIETKIEEFGKDNKYQNIEIVYLATPTDDKYKCQTRFKENQLFTEEELKDYVNEYFKNRKNS